MQMIMADSYPPSSAMLYYRILIMSLIILWSMRINIRAFRYSYLQHYMFSMTFETHPRFIYHKKSLLLVDLCVLHLLFLFSSWISKSSILITHQQLWLSYSLLSTNLGYVGKWWIWIRMQVIANNDISLSSSSISCSFCIN